MQVKNEGPTVQSSLSQFLQEQWMKLKWNRTTTSSNNSKHQEIISSDEKDEIDRLLDDECEKIIEEISDISSKETCIRHYVTNRCKTASSEELMELLKVHSFIRSASKKKLKNNNTSPLEFANNFTATVMEKILFSKACNVKPNQVSKKIFTKISTPPDTLANKSTNEPSMPHRSEGERDKQYPFYPCPKKSFQVFQSCVGPPKCGNKITISIQTEDRCPHPPRTACDCCCKKPVQKKICVPKNFKELLKEKNWEELDFPECKNPNCTCAMSVYRKKIKYEDCNPEKEPIPPKTEDRGCEAKCESTENICIQAGGGKSKEKKTKKAKPKSKKKGSGCFCCHKKQKEEEEVPCGQPECECPVVKEIQVQMPVEKCCQSSQPKISIIESAGCRSCESATEVCTTTLIVCGKCGRLVKKKQKKSCPVKRCPTSTVIVSSTTPGKLSAADTAALKTTIKAEANRNYGQMERILQELRMQRQDLQKLNQMYEDIIGSLKNEGQTKNGQINDLCSTKKCLENGNNKQGKRKSSISGTSPDIGYCDISELYRKMKPAPCDDCNKEFKLFNYWKLFEYGDKQLKNLVNKSRMILNCSITEEQLQKSNQDPSDEENVNTNTFPSDNASILTLFDDKDKVSNDPKKLKSVSTLTDISGIPEDGKLQSEVPDNDKNCKQKLTNHIDDGCHSIEVLESDEKINDSTRSNIPFTVTQPLLTWIKDSLNFMKKKGDNCSKNISKKFNSKVHVCKQQTRYKLRRYIEKRMMANRRSAL